MTALFPTAIVSTSNIPDALPLSTLSANNHAGKHNDLRDEIIAIETKLGKNGDTNQNSMDYKVSEILTTDKAVGKSAVQTLTNKILGTLTKIILGSDAIGDMYYAGVSNVLTRLGIGTSGQILSSTGTSPVWTSPSSVNTNYGTDTGAADAYVFNPSIAIGSYTGGLQVQFIATNANTGTSTINVSSLGVKTIKKLDGATNLLANDIKAGMLVALEYNATSGFFIMLNPVANAPLLPNGDGSALTNVPNTATYACGVTNYDLTTATGTQNIAHGLGKTPKFIKITYIYETGPVATLPVPIRQGFGTFNGTSYSGQYVASTSGSPSASYYSNFNNSSSIINYNQGGGGSNVSQIATASLNSTNIVLSWTKTNSPSGNLLMAWEAFA
jgi:hypothetical protein